MRTSLRGGWRLEPLLPISLYLVFVAARVLLLASLLFFKGDLLTLFGGGGGLALGLLVRGWRRR